MVAQPGHIDSHIHLFDNGFIGLDGRSPAGGDEVVEYETVRQRWHIDSALVVGYEGESAYRGNNAYIQQMARRHSWIKPVAYVHHSATVREVQECLDAGFYGISIYAIEETDSQPLVDLLSRVGPVLAERRAIISFNASPAVYPALRTALPQLAGVAALISHFGLPAKGADAAQEAREALQSLGGMREFSNVFVKASGFYAFSNVLSANEALSSVIEQFGSGRIMWGSDYPVVLSSESFEQTLTHMASVPDGDRQGILGQSLRAILDEVELP